MRQETLEQRVWFPGRAEALAQEPWPPARQEAFRRIIARYLDECEQRTWPLGANGSRRPGRSLPATCVACQSVEIEWAAEGAT